MAITKETVLSQVECVKMDTWKVLQVKTLVRVLEDGVEIASTNHRTTLYPNETSASLAAQPADVQNIANLLWTDSHKTAYSEWLVASGSL
tara:strand:+ start:992 stop:1261 length:270 start_codon:yes stop_codon:yes gene_type:complete